MFKFTKAVSNHELLNENSWKMALNPGKSTVPRENYLYLRQIVIAGDDDNASRSLLT